MNKQLILFEAISDQWQAVHRRRQDLGQPGDRPGGGPGGRPPPRALGLNPDDPSFAEHYADELARVVSRLAELARPEDR